jgi:hypothetical protein
LSRFFVSPPCCSIGKSHARSRLFRDRDLPGVISPNAVTGKVYISARCRGRLQHYKGINASGVGTYRWKRTGAR